MRSKIAVLGVVLFAATVPFGTAQARTAQRPPTLAEMGAIVGHRYDQPLPPAGQSPFERARWLLRERDAVGSTPEAWLAWQKRTFRLGVTAAAPAADLVASVVTLDALAGVPLNSSQRAELAASVARIPVQVRAPLASLVSSVTTAYAEQVPLARTIVARLVPDVDLATLVTRAERDAMTARQTSILRAVDAFNAHTASFFATHAIDGAVFADPAGLVIVGGTGNDTYTRNEGVLPDPILLVDPAGNDRYENSAGGACPIWPGESAPPVPVPIVGGRGTDWLQCNGVAISVLADLGDGAHGSSDDMYLYDGGPAAVQGAGGPGGIGLLVDAGGNDLYHATMTRCDDIAFFNYFDGGGQGYGYGGEGALLDVAGDDTYRFDVYSSRGHSIWALAQGFGGAGGLGTVTDLGGNDHWLAEGLGLRGGGFEGIYNDGVGFYGGVGLFSDLGAGNDVVRATVTADSVDFYAQGFAAFGGLGIMYDDGGDDSYWTYEEATAAKPAIDPILNCAYGTASYGGVGIMIDAWGDDSYYGASVSTKGSFVMDNGWGGPGVGYGLFVDQQGDDSYVMEAKGPHPIIAGRGDQGAAADGEPNWFGTFIDSDGTDSYVGGVGENNTTWLWMGVDQDQ